MQYNIDFFCSGSAKQLLTGFERSAKALLSGKLHFENSDNSLFIRSYLNDDEWVTALIEREYEPYDDYTIEINQVVKLEVVNNSYNTFALEQLAKMIRIVLELSDGDVCASGESAGDFLVRKGGMLYLSENSDEYTMQMYDALTGPYILTDDKHLSSLIYNE